MLALRMSKFVCMRWFDGEPRTGGELVFDIICQVIAEKRELKLEIVRDEIHQIDMGSITWYKVRLALATIKQTYKRNRIGKKHVKENNDVYNDLLSGTFIYVQPRPKSPSVLINLFLNFKNIVDFITRGGRSNIRIAIYASEFARNEFRRREARIEAVIYPPFLRVADRENLPKEDKILTLSRIDPSKNLDLIGEASEKTQFSFTIVGYLEDRNLKYYQRLLRDYPKLQIIPNASEAVKRNHLERSKIYVHTGLAEAFPISKLEAMNYGLVPIVPEFGGAKEGLPENCVYYSSEDLINKITSSIENYSDEDAFFFRRLSEEYTVDKFKAQLSDILN